MATVPAAPTTPVATGTWVVDPDHTTLEFRVKHVGIAKVRGVFTEFEGVLESEPDGRLRAHGTVAAASLETRVAARDAHLRSADFFDVERHPELRFASTAIELAGDGAITVRGDLTIRDVTRAIVLEGELLGVAVDDEGRTRVGLELDGRLDRRDFGLTWNAAVEGGGVLVGHRVDVHLDVSAVLS
jgi:polyisoprenoid-binding protein YceI